MKLQDIPRDVFSCLLAGITDLSASSGEFKALASSLKELELQLETDHTVSSKDVSALIQSGIQIIASNQLATEHTEGVYKLFDQLLNTEACPQLSRFLVQLHKIPYHDPSILRGRCPPVWILPEDIFYTIEKINYAASELVDVMQAIEDICSSKPQSKLYIRAITSLTDQTRVMLHNHVSKEKVCETLRAVTSMLGMSLRFSDVEVESDRCLAIIIRHEHPTTLAAVFAILDQYNLASPQNCRTMLFLCELQLAHIEEQLNQLSNRGEQLTQVEINVSVSSAKIKDFTFSREDIKSDYRAHVVSAHSYTISRFENHENNMISEQIDQECEQFLCFLDVLEYEIPQYGSMLISIGPWGGCYGQYLPSYMLNIAKSEKVLICLIDPEFLGHKNEFYNNFKNDLIAPPSTTEECEFHKPWRYRSRNKECNLTLAVFPCHIPNVTYTNIGCRFSKLFEKALVGALDRGTHVYIGNHTEICGLESIPLIAEVYNKIKRTHSLSQLLQLYTQGGEPLFVTYYLDLPYNRLSEYGYRDSSSGDLRKPAAYTPFYLSTFEDLNNLDEFRPRSLKSLAACLRAKIHGTNSTHVREILSVLESNALFTYQKKIAKIVCIARHANHPTVRLFAASHVFGKGRHKNMQMFYDKVQQLQEQDIKGPAQLEVWIKSGLVLTHPANELVETSQATRSRFFRFFHRSAAVSPAVVEPHSLPQPARIVS